MQRNPKVIEHTEVCDAWRRPDEPERRVGPHRRFQSLPPDHADPPPTTVRQLRSGHRSRDTTRTCSATSERCPLRSDPRIPTSRFTGRMGISAPTGPVSSSEAIPGIPWSGSPDDVLGTHKILVAQATVDRISLRVDHRYFGVRRPVEWPPTRAIPAIHWCRWAKSRDRITGGAAK